MCSQTDSLTGVKRAMTGCVARPVIEKMIQRTKDHRDDHIWERLAWNNADHKNLLDM